MPPKAQELSRYDAGEHELKWAFSGHTTGEGVPVEAYAHAIEIAERTACDHLLREVPAALAVLDLGAGEGYFSSALFEATQSSEFRATWIDKNPIGMAEGASSAKYPVKRIPADLSQKRWRKMVPDASFDVAVIGILAHHLPENAYADLVRACTHEKLRPGGAMLLVELCRGLYAAMDVRCEEVADEILEVVSGAANVAEACFIDVRIRVPELHKQFAFRFIAARAGRLAACRLTPRSS